MSITLSKPDFVHSDIRFKQYFTRLIKSVENGINSIPPSPPGPPGPGFEEVTIVTTNASSNVLYQKTVDPGSIFSARALIIAETSTGNIAGKFVREFTVKRLGSNIATLLQELVPSIDYKESISLTVSCGTSGNNAVINVTGIPGTLTWHCLVESI
jgi:hypothetical protein